MRQNILLKITVIYNKMYNGLGPITYLVLKIYF